MLIKFVFKNYKSFKDETTLNLSAGKNTEFSEHVRITSGNKILPITAIFGANASGKSTVFNAFEYMSNYVVNSFNYGDENENFDRIKPTPFLFSKDSANAESKFEVYFTLNGDKHDKTYNYGFCIDKSGISREWFNVRSKTSRAYKPIFSRNNDVLDLTGLPMRSRANIQIALEKQVLISSLGAKLKIEKCKMIRDWFLANEFADFGNPFTNLLISRTLPKDFVENIETQQRVIRYFNTFDDQIKGFIIKKTPINKGDDDLYEILSTHKMIDSDDNAEIPLENESAGTLKMFAIFPMLYDVLNKGGVFFVDELNARLHPLLTKNILELFISIETNPNHAQLILTTHDTLQMSNKLLRRDEIWFTSKNNTGISTLYSLANYEDSGAHIRKDENYLRNYLEGKYGAVPMTKAIDLLID